jgi:hypothetical protein
MLDMRLSTAVAACGLTVVASAAASAGASNAHRAATAFPHRLTGSVNYTITTHATKRGGSSRHETILLNVVSMRLVSVDEKGAAHYSLVRARPTFKGSEDVKLSSCATQHIVWGRWTGHPVSGTLVVATTKPRASASYQFLVPERGVATRRGCGTRASNKRSRVTLAVTIGGKATLKLAPSRPAAERFVVFGKSGASILAPNYTGSNSVAVNFHP